VQPMYRIGLLFGRAINPATAWRYTSSLSPILLQRTPVYVSVRFAMASCLASKYIGCGSG